MIRRRNYKFVTDPISLLIIKLYSDYIFACDRKIALVDHLILRAPPYGFGINHFIVKGGGIL